MPEGKLTFMGKGTIISFIIKVLMVISCFVLTYFYKNIGAISFLFLILPTFIRTDPDKDIRAKNDRICTDVTVILFIIFILFCVLSIRLNLYQNLIYAFIIIATYTIFLIKTSYKFNKHLEYGRPNKFFKNTGNDIDEAIKITRHELFEVELNKIDPNCYQVYKLYYLENKKQNEVINTLNIGQNNLQTYLNIIRSIFYFKDFLK